jgi:putative ABC transport system permease protein
MRWSLSLGMGEGCCLGIFGLAAFAASQRNKEIAIRKGLGASVFNVWKMLSRDFVLLVAISILLAVLLAHYFQPMATAI